LRELALNLGNKKKGVGRTCSDQREEDAFGPNIVDDGCFELSSGPFPAKERVRGDHVYGKLFTRENLGRQPVSGIGRADEMKEKEQEVFFVLMAACRGLAIDQLICQLSDSDKDQ